MTDKEKIRTDLLAKLEILDKPVYNKEEFNQGKLEGFKEVLAFLDSIPARPVDEDLAKFVEDYAYRLDQDSTLNDEWINVEDVEKAMIACAAFQEEKDKKLLQQEGIVVLPEEEFETMKRTLIKLSEENKNDNEALEDEIAYLSKRFPEVSFAKLSRIAVHVAKWQKQRLLEKESITGTLDVMEFPSKMWIELSRPIVGGNDGDKVKVIVVEDKL